VSKADSSTPAGLVDLASARLGGFTLLANDEFFAEKENLLKPGRGIFLPDEYTERGKWMDGWETRRRRTPGNDWCVVRLGLRGIIKQVDIDTNHFLGNHPPLASLDALCLTNELFLDVGAVTGLPWVPILTKSPLQPGAQNLFDITSDQPWTHLRLNIFPDGGVARLRVYGKVVPDWGNLKPDELIYLVAVENGGVPLACSDMFFSSMNNLIMPGRSTNMGDGWETKRRRGPGHDWIILQLGLPGTLQKIEVDTNHFKGNYPDQCSIEGCRAPGASVIELTGPQAVWRAILPKTKLQADTRHFFERELAPMGDCTHLRLNIYPDGGVSRLRGWGLPGRPNE
jgi:allantoicase